MLAHLRIVRADGRTEDTSLPPGTYGVGRDVGHIALHDPDVSGNHARLDVRTDGVTITDMGSSNGTFDPQGRRLTQPTVMGLDQAFRLGSSSITLTYVVVPSGGTRFASSALAPLPTGPAGPAPWGAPAPGHWPAAVNHAGAGRSFGQPGAFAGTGPRPPTASGAGRPSDGRLLGPGVLGGLVGGVLSCIPVLGALNLVCCLFDVIGAIIGLSIYFDKHPGEKLSGRDAAVLGLISGVTTGLFYATFSFFAVGPMLALAGARSLSVISTPISTFKGVLVVAVLIYSAFGALGGFLGLLVFFGKRRAS